MLNLNCPYCNNTLISNYSEYECPQCSAKIFTTNKNTIKWITITKFPYYIEIDMSARQCHVANTYDPWSLAPKQNRIIELDYIPNFIPQTAQSWLDGILNLKALL